MHGLGDDDTLPKIGPDQLGIIRVDVKSVSYLDMRPWRAGTSNPSSHWSGSVHEQSLKAGSHRVVYVMSMDLSTVLTTESISMGAVVEASDNGLEQSPYRPDRNSEVHICSFVWKHDSKGTSEEIS
jgi:hypothetical protein